MHHYWVITVIKMSLRTSEYVIQNNERYCKKSTYNETNSLAADNNSSSLFLLFTSILMLARFSKFKLRVSKRFVPDAVL